MRTIPESGPVLGRGHSNSNPFWSDIPELATDLERVRDIVRRDAASAGGSIGVALERYVSRPGKMLRPGMVLIGSWAGASVGAASDRIVQIAAAIETLHLASLVHDDVIDEADRRRGEPSLHTLYGRKHAVLMGDFLLTRCFSMIAEGTDRDNALRLAAATGHLIRGEISQNFGSASMDLSLRGYLRRIAGKTAVLFGLSLVTGASETKAKRRELALLARIGYNLGMAFQIIDDILDYTASPDSLGKPVASDLRSGIYTLPVIEAIRSEPRVLAMVVPTPANQASIQHALHAIETAGGIDRARVHAAKYTDRATNAIRSLANPRQREVLGIVCERLLGRDY